MIAATVLDDCNSELLPLFWLMFIRPVPPTLLMLLVEATGVEDQLCVSLSENEKEPFLSLVTRSVSVELLVIWAAPVEPLPSTEPNCALTARAVLAVRSAVVVVQAQLLRTMPSVLPLCSWLFAPLFCCTLVRPMPLMAPVTLLPSVPEAELPSTSPAWTDAATAVLASRNGSSCLGLAYALLP